MSETRSTGTLVVKLLRSITSAIKFGMKTGSRCAINQCSMACPGVMALKLFQSIITNYNYKDSSYGSISGPLYYHAL